MKKDSFISVLFSFSFGLVFSFSTRLLSADEGRSRLPTTDLDLLPSADAGSTWCIYDVGGSRTSVSFVHLGFVCVSPYTLQRAAWLPFFDDAHAILFLAPINCFDEQLAEDPRVNRLQDSMILWKSIVSSKLLTGCSIVCASLANPL